MSDTCPTSNTSRDLFSGHFLHALSRDGTRPFVDQCLKSIKNQVDEWDWRSIVSISKRLYANMGIPKGAIDLKAMLSVGTAWMPTYEGPASAWGAKATKWLLDEFFPVCDVRGPMFDFKTSLFLDSVSIDREGDFLHLLTASESGYPLTQAIPNHLVKNPPGVRNGRGSTIEMKVPKYLVDKNAGPEEAPVSRTYKVSVIHNGIAYSQYGRPFAYCVFEEAAEPYANSTAYKWVHETYIIHTFDPEWYEQGRGFPAFTHAVRQFLSMLTSQEFEELTQMILSSISLVETNEDGLTDTLDPTQTIGGSGRTLADKKEDQAAGVESLSEDVVIDRILGGVVRYFKAGSGGKVESMAKNSPGDMWENFQDRLIRTSLAGINMPYSVVWKGNDDNGTSNRVSIEKLHRTINDRQSLLTYGALRKIRYALSVAMKTGRLPRQTNWYQWGFTMPPEFTIDDGRAAEARRKDYVMGLSNLTPILATGGRTVEAHLRERAEEEALKQIIVIETNEKYKAQGVLITKDDLGTVAPATGPAAKDATTDDEDDTAPAKDETKPKPKQD